MGNMSVEYRFTGLASMADYCGNKATQLRASIDDKKPKSRRNVEKRAEATVWESVADLLRNTKLTEK